jgi:FHA domain
MGRLASFDHGGCSMTSNGEAVRRPARTPLRQRSRKRWAIAGGIAAAWMMLYIFTGSLVSATLILLVLAVLGVAGVTGLRALGVTRDHPWLVRMASRPWRDGQDVLRVAMRHMSDVFVVTPSGSLLAPNVVELQLNQDDLASLCERMELGVICASLTEVYEEQVAAYDARFARASRAEVYVTAGPMPPGRYRLRQGDAVTAGGRRPDAQYPDAAYPDVQYPEVRYADAAPELAYAGRRAAYDGASTQAWYEPDPGPGLDPVPAPDADPDLTIGASGMVTVMERETPAVPLLRLVTGSAVAETRMSGARAGRGFVELVLPEVATVSREHATFTFADGRWRITNMGRNGLTLNGAPVTGEQPLSDGDAIRWGARSDALLSRVEIS